MLKKTYRLTREQFPSLRASKRVFGDRFSLSYIKNGLSHNRFSVVVSTKSIKTSVERHRVRRVVYDAVEKYQVPSLIGKDFVISTKTPFPKSNNEEIEREIHTLLKTVL